MGSSFPKPPSISAWLLLLLCASLVSQELAPEPLGAIAGLLVIGGGVFALAVVGGWIGLVLGSSIASFNRGMAEGYEQGRSEARRAREERGQ